MKLYSIPKLVKYDDLKKTWYVYFRYKGKVVKFTKDINRLSSHKERLMAGEALAKVTLERLKAGWNPLLPELEETKADTYTLAQALDFAFDKKKPLLADKTIKDYACTLRFIKTSIRELGLGYLGITETRRAHVKLILEDIKARRGWSNKAYNKGLAHFQAILSELLQWDVIEYSPASKIRTMPVEETNANIPPTPQQDEKIKTYLREHAPEQLVFLAVQFHTGIRPVEITRLRFSMIDIENRVINMPAAITKNRKHGRVVPIVPDLWQYLAPALSLNYPPDWFLFGSHRIPGRGNEGKYRDFIPGPTQMKRDTSTTRWRKEIKETLGVNVNQYAYKKMGGDAKYNAGIPLEAIQSIFGHSDKATTQIYVKAVKESYMRTVIEKSPEF